MKYLSSNGDTIVEVLISVAIVSAVLGAAFTSATHSLNNSRQSQERGEALKIAETELEQIKAYAGDLTKNVYESTFEYCFDSTITQQKFNSPTYNPSADTLDSADFTKYPAGCTFQSLYHVSIKYTPPTAPGPPPSLDDNFVILVRWERFAGNRDEIKMVYRLHK